MRRAYESTPLHAYPRIWERSHRDVVFRLDTRRVRRLAAPAGLFAPLLEWVTPDMVLERRFLLASFPAHVPYRERRARTRDALRAAALRGYVTIMDPVAITARTFRPTSAWCQTVEVPERRWKESALDHGQLAIEAAIAALGANGEFAGEVRFETEADVLAATRVARSIRRGDALGAVADLITTDGYGRRRATEIISENYRDDNIAAKYDGIAQRVDFVATSSAVATRVVAATGAPCLHF